MIREEICTYEVCKLATEKGFDWGCLYHYDRKGSLHQHYAYNAMNRGVGVDDLLMYDGHLYTSECLAPTQSLLQRWLREEKGIHISVEYEWVEGIDDWTFWSYIKKINNAKVVDDAIKSGFNTYELALEDALKYALENLA
jgi:hypothetical protein